MQAQPSSVATRNGVIAGVILGILSLPVIALTAAGRAFGLGGMLPTLFLLVALVVCAVAGFSAGRRSGRARSGAWAGFLAALITAFIAICLGIVILILLAPGLLAPVAHRASHIAARPALAGRLAFMRLFLGALILLVGGVIAGLIGGLLGRLGRPHDSQPHGPQYAPYAPTSGGPQTSTTPFPPAAQAPMAGFAATTQSAPPSYYPDADSGAPTTLLENQG